MRLKWKISSLDRFLSLRFLSLHLYLVLLLFQLSQLTRAPFFYLAGEIVFFALVALLGVCLIRRLRREKILILALGLIVLIRLPFYVHPDGLVTTSDNAIDALQTVEIQDTHVPPFFLLEDVKHMGTIRNLWTAYFNDLLGSSYLTFVLVELGVFIAFLFAFQEFFKGSLGRKVLIFFPLLHFAFIETFFDTSLSLRGGPYLEMVLFFVFGAILFDFDFENKTRTFLSYTFVFFSIYIHPLSSLFVGSFLLCTLIYALSRRKLIRTAVLAAAGMAAGLFHWFYYLLFFPAKPVVSGSWEKIGLLPFSKLTPAYFGHFIKNFWGCFRNLFGYEFSYLKEIMPAGTERTVLGILNEAVIFLSFAVLVAGVAIIIRKIIRLIAGKDDLHSKNWVFIFLFFLLGAELAKVFVFYPPHRQPRHNFELLFLVMASYLLVFSRLFKRLSLRSWKTITASLLFLAFAAPHALYFYKNAVSKESSYHKLMAVLNQNNVRVLTGDFNIVFSIYYLSGRTILVSDSIGPYVSAFYPELRDHVDKIPAEKKAYIFYSVDYPSRPWNRKATKTIKTRLLDRFRKDGIPYKIVELKDFLVVVPSPKR